MCICMHPAIVMSSPLLSARPKPMSKSHTTRESHARTRQVWPSAAVEAKGFPEHHPILSRHNAALLPAIIIALSVIGQHVQTSMIPTLTLPKPVMNLYCARIVSSIYRHASQSCSLVPDNESGSPNLR
jgi:hypothetical protein